MLPGDVEAFYNASIHGQTSGYVSEWRKDIGAKVHQGDVLAVVDTPELDQRIAVAESELAQGQGQSSPGASDGAALEFAAQRRRRCRSRPPTRRRATRAPRAPKSRPLRPMSTD